MTRHTRSEYLTHANEVAALARRAATHEERRALEAIAATWRRLASDTAPAAAPARDTTRGD